VIRFGACECCKLLREEVLFLRSLVRPKTVKFESLPSVTLEADAVLGGTDQQMEFSEEERQRQVEIDSERAKILSGNY
jgi:hypothetical protein